MCLSFTVNSLSFVLLFPRFFAWNQSSFKHNSVAFVCCIRHPFVPALPHALLLVKILLNTLLPNSFKIAPSKWYFGLQVSLFTQPYD